MTHALAESTCEYAMSLQSAIRAGWSFDMEYGEERLGFSSRLIATRGDVVVTLRDPWDLSELFDGRHDGK